MGWTHEACAPCLVQALLLSMQSWHGYCCPLRPQCQHSEPTFREIHGSERHLSRSCGAWHFPFLPRKGWAGFAPAASSSRAQCELGGLSGAAGEWPGLRILASHHRGHPKEQGSGCARTWGKFSGFKRFSVPGWNKSQGDLTVFLKENSRGKRCGDDSNSSASVSFFFFHFSFGFTMYFPF